MSSPVEVMLERMMSAVPNHLGIIKSSLKKSFRPLLQSAFDDLGLVTREEFDAQLRVLHTARSQLTQLLLHVDHMDGTDQLPPKALPLLAPSMPLDDKSAH